MHRPAGNAERGRQDNRVNDAAAFIVAAQAWFRSRNRTDSRQLFSVGLNCAFTLSAVVTALPARAPTTVLATVTS
jgi:hypothetical protein